MRAQVLFFAGVFRMSATVNLFVCVCIVRHIVRSFIALVNFSFEQFVLYLNATFAAAVATCDILFRASAHSTGFKLKRSFFSLGGFPPFFSLSLFGVSVSEFERE